MFYHSAVQFFNFFCDFDNNYTLFQTDIILWMINTDNMNFVSTD